MPRANATELAVRALSRPRQARVPEHAITMLEARIPWHNAMTCADFHKEPIKEGDPYYCPAGHCCGYERPLRIQRMLTEAADRERFERQLQALEERAKKQRIKPEKFRADKPRLDMNGVL